MRRSFFILVSFVVGSFCIAGQAQTRHRLNSMIDLLEQKKPQFGVYWPGNPQGRRGGRRRPTRPRSHPPSGCGWLTRRRLLFNGSMEGGVDRAWWGD
jgi:hypothetical protein